MPQPSFFDVPSETPVDGKATASQFLAQLVHIYGTGDVVFSAYFYRDANEKGEVVYQVPIYTSKQPAVQAKNP